MDKKTYEKYLSKKEKARETIKYIVSVKKNLPEWVTPTYPYDCGTE